MRVFTILVSALLAVAPGIVSEAVAQGTIADYERAGTLTQRYRGKERKVGDLLWLPGGDLIASRFVAGADAPEFVRITAAGAVTTGATLAELGIESPITLPPQRDRARSRDGGGRVTVTFENALAQPVRLGWVDRRGRVRSYGEVAPGESKAQSTWAGHVWRGLLPGDGVAGVFVAAGIDGVARFDAESRSAAGRRGASPQPQRTSERRGSERDAPVCRCRGDNVWLLRDGEERQITTDGTASNSYRGRVWQSPAGERALVFQTQVVGEREIYTIEAAPSDQLQPKLHTQRYRKPGDDLDRPVPRLFDLAGGKRIDVDPAPFADAWSIGRVQWAADGSEVFLLHNRRGHQVLTVFAIDAMTGAVRTVLEERSATFVDYSQKTVLRWLGDTGEFLWASERSGYNHLYRVDAATGAVAPVTQGNWVFRGLERVDLEAGEVWFTALGIRPDQDPYHAHLARVGLDGAGLTVLTKGDGSHAWEFSPDGSHFVDRWSRVDLPEVVEVRRSTDGELVAEVGRADVGALLQAGFQPPIRFTAPGRDGVTPIHGLLILPSNFDPAQRYPVIEDIYAGPHGFHVPKRFGLMTRQRELAELGFVIARIDGMGTNWRSKAFHDVCWRNLKDAGFPDRIAWLRAAAVKYPFLDLDRVGIYGGSAGGQNALAALLHHGEFYGVAASDCGCHDNRMDKIWWNEAWMGHPIGPWYADSSNVTHASKLTGKLLLTVGELDRNVDPASTMQVVGALIDADKDFDLVVFPGGGHGIGESGYLRRRRQDFFVRHLLGVEPRTR